MQTQPTTKWLPISLIVLAAAIVFGAVMFAGPVQTATHCDQLNQQYLKVPSPQNKAEYEHACGTAAAAATVDADIFSSACRSYEMEYDSAIGRTGVTPDPRAAQQAQAAYAQRQCGRLPGYPTALGQ